MCRWPFDAHHLRPHGASLDRSESGRAASGDRMRSPLKAEGGYSSPQSDNLQHPDADKTYDDDVQNRLDAGGHGDVVIDYPQYDADYDQRHDNV